jgi:hypothetical protein
MSRFRRIITVASLVAAPAALFAQSRFEGTITARMGNSDATFSMKGDQFRMDMAGRGMSMYMLRDMSKNTTYMVMPAQRMYMEPSQGTIDSQERKQPELKWTGKTETVAGQQCEHLLITGDDGTYDVCAAKGMGTFPMVNSQLSRSRAAMETWQRLGRDVFPLKVTKPGSNEPTFEVIKIEKKSLDDSFFKLPDGFTKMDMGRMGRPPAN